MAYSGCCAIIASRSFANAVAAAVRFATRWAKLALVNGATASSLSEVALHSASVKRVTQLGSRVPNQKQQRWDGDGSWACWCEEA